MFISGSSTVASSLNLQMSMMAALVDFAGNEVARFLITNY